MSEYCYKKALKFGQREYRACVAAGKNPYLPALDDFIPPVRSAAGSDQGLISVPAEFIVGTKTKAARMGIELPSEADTENPVIADECLEKKTVRVQL